MSISFKNFERENILSLNDFLNVGISHPVIQYSLSFMSNGFSVKQIFEAEPLDLEYLLDGLTYLRDNLKGTFVFEPVISGRINIKFEMSNQGHISISGVIFDKLHSISLVFKFSTDQTFLPDLISQCATTIKSLNKINN